MASVITRAAPSSSPPRERAAGAPVLISADGSNPVLERIALSKDGIYDEAWLQDLIFFHPELLPVSQIEPAFSTLVPAAMEVSCAHGNIDNVYLTPTGELVLVEAKLWRNPEARRKVVAQALDYVVALQTLGYSGFEAAVMRAAGQPTASLYSLVADHPDVLSEADFIDAVSHNLKRGRMLALIVGDGIHRETETLAELLASHAGAHFTLALVEIATYRNLATGDIFAVPSTLLKTEMIERGIVVIQDDRTVVRPMTPQAVSHPKSISQEMFYEELAKRSASLPQQLQRFVTTLEPLGVYTDLGKTLGLKVDLPDRTKPLSLGYIQKNGQLWTDTVHASAPADAAQQYLSRIASLIGGSVKQGNYPTATTNGTSAPHLDLLLPAHEAGWRAAISDLINAVRQAADQD